jgi:hypothetical protein
VDRNNAQASETAPSGAAMSEVTFGESVKERDLAVIANNR